MPSHPAQVFASGIIHAKDSAVHFLSVHVPGELSCMDIWERKDKRGMSMAARQARQKNQKTPAISIKI